MTRAKQSVYKNIAVRWKAETAGDTEFTQILSPYITAPTSETVTRDLDPSTCDIYTLFSAETFASGSSSLKAIKKLFQQGFTLYHLPGLHAKVFLTSEGFASVGSQNLTGRGTRSLEASSVLSEKKQVYDLRKLIESWIQARELITLEMILDMEDLLRPIIKLFVAAQKTAAEADLLIVEKDKARRDEKRRFTERARYEAEERTRREEAARLLELQRTISESIQSQSPVICRVQSVPTGSWDSPSSTSSLMVSDTYQSLVRWIINSHTYKLARLNRYVCLLEASGKFGWARVGKTRITFFDSGVSRYKRLLLGGISCQLQFYAMWSKVGKGVAAYNLVIGVKPQGTYKDVRVHAWFSLNSVKIVDIPGAGVTDSNSHLRNWIQDNQEEFKQKMLELFLDSYTYESLSGVQASTFLGSYGRYYKVRLHLIAGRPLLVLATLT